MLAGKRSSRGQSITRRSGGNKPWNVRSLIILRSGEDLTSFNENNCVNVSGEWNNNKLIN